MEMQTWRRIKCDICERWYEMFLPHTTWEIVADLRDKDWGVEAGRENYRVNCNMHITTPLSIARVQCPCCRKGK